MNAYDHADTLAKLGINIPNLGCVMLDVALPFKVADFVPEESLYTSQHPDRSWIKGNVGDEQAHVTLLYGLIESAHIWRKHIEAVLDDWNPPVNDLYVERWEGFPSTFEDEDYVCIVGRVALTPSIMEAHARLSYLPHIDTHPEYKPHVTLAYVRKADAEDILDRLNSEVIYIDLDPIKLNYGRRPARRTPGE